MSNTLRYGTAVLVLVLAIIIVRCIRKNSLNLKYSLVWLVMLFSMFVAVIIPDFLEIVAKWLGFEVMSNMLFLIAIVVLLLVSLSLTMIVSKQSSMIKLLVQEVSILKSNQKGDN